MAIKVGGTTVVDDTRRLINHRLNTVEISTNTTAVTGTYYVTTADLTLTLPASPVVGDLVGIQNSSGTVTCIIAGNGSPIMSIPEDLIVDTLHQAFYLQYAGATRGWVFA